MAVEDAFSVAFLDLDLLRRTEVGRELYGCVERANWEVGWLVDAAESGLEDLREYARRAQRAVRELFALLEELDSDDRKTRDRLYLARDAVEDLLDALVLLTRDLDEQARRAPPDEIEARRSSRRLGGSVDRGAHVRVGAIR